MWVMRRGSSLLPAHASHFRSPPLAILRTIGPVRVGPSDNDIFGSGDAKPHLLASYFQDCDIDVITYPDRLACPTCECEHYAAFLVCLSFSAKNLFLRRNLRNSGRLTNVSLSIM